MLLLTRPVSFDIINAENKREGARYDKKGCKRPIHPPCNRTRPFCMYPFFYLPRHLFSKTRILPREDDGGDLLVMSANVRCYMPNELFKRS